ncbi:MAG: FKBP-type peptidyl-prolyl cis-trans isomerase [Gemmatimonadota bacterium]|nr:FKBP-type peptidyl-prolyl cis-trans isomerase [Gemmatimonadota bacterium]
MHRRSFIAIALALSAGALAVDGCTTSLEPPPFTDVDPTTLTYAASLGVDFAAMTKLPSGLWVRDFVVGTGAAVATGKTVTVKYSGYLPSGVKFDENISAGIVFTVGSLNVIAGFDQGVIGMKVGGKRKLVMPPSLGYGATVHGSIPANSVLIFDIELVSVT